MVLPNWPAADVDKEKCKASAALLTMGPWQKAVGWGLLLGVWSAQSKEVLPSLTALTHTPNLIFLCSSGKDKETSTSPKKASPRIKRKSWNCWAPVLCPAVLCSEHPKILEEDWDAQNLPFSGTLSDSLEGKKPGHWTILFVPEKQFWGDTFCTGTSWCFFLTSQKFCLGNEM